MQIRLTEKHIRTGEERAFELFQSKLAEGKVYVRREQAMRFRGIGREMVQRVYQMARHIEGAKVSRSLGKRGVDSVSLNSVRTALRSVGNGLVRIANTRAARGEKPDGVLSGTKAELGRASRAGGTLARWIHRNA